MGSPNFVDHVKLICRSGKGGAGSAHLHRGPSIPKGGPDGGDGGRGGDIILRANRNFWTLLHLRYTKHLIAENGKSGGSSRKHGADGKDQIIEVPPGTVAKDADTGELIGEVTRHNEELTLLKGGRGGLGNDHFKSSTNQTPRYAQPGEKGSEKEIVLELKLLADVGLVGFPNAGKSTLLSVISAAKPEIADYPFTTITPNLGMIAYRDAQSFVMADIPGIIEGAHLGKGIGLRFLRHIERNAILLFMVPADVESIEKEYNILINELRSYNPELLDKDRILAITKSDLLDEELKTWVQADIPKDIPFVFISALANIGLTDLKDLIWSTLNH
ncbi:MAG: GTPase ObgE [Bacteroidales bacterium]|nr:GTPase ObgE [Bacteroidales bacterium]